MSTPVEALPEMTLRAREVFPPTVLLLAPSLISTPSSPLGTFVPSLLRPMVFPYTLLLSVPSPGICAPAVVVGGAIAEEDPAPPSFPRASRARRPGAEVVAQDPVPRGAFLHGAAGGVVAGNAVAVRGRPPADGVVTGPIDHHPVHGVGLG